VLELTSGDQLDVRHLWHRVDEQALPFALRKQLADQGLRCGLMGAQVPGWIRDKLSQQCKQLRLDEDRGTAMPDDIAVQRRLQCRSGQKRYIPVGRTCDRLTLDAPAGESAGPQTYSDCQCQLAVTVTPRGDGTVELELTPEIHHGQPRQRWIGQTGLFHAEITQDTAAFDALSIQATLTPGQTFVIAASSVTGRLSQAFCDGLCEDTAPGKLVLLRLAQTQLDDLFDPQQRLTPIATLPK
jgi:hypothetical protein